MVDNLEAEFNRLASRYFDRMSSSDEEIAVEYPIRNPPKRKNAKSFKGEKKEFTESKKRKHVSSDGKNYRLFHCYCNFSCSS